MTGLRLTQHRSVQVCEAQSGAVQTIDCNDCKPENRVFSLCAAQVASAAQVAGTVYRRGGDVGDRDLDGLLPCDASPSLLILLRKLGPSSPRA